MPAKSYLPPGLPAELARPLVGASARIAELKPWEFMSDLHLVGVRDATTGELHVASVMGALRQVFGVIFYCRALGLRYIHKMATEAAGPDPEAAIKALDYLRPEEIEWLPLVPGPVPPPEPVVLSAEDRAALQDLPLRSACIFELVARLMPEMSFFDEEAHRPVCGRIGLLSDRASFYILTSQVVHGAAPLREVAGKALVKGLLAAKARPSVIHVDSKDLLEVLRPAGESIGVPVRLVESLPAASDALAQLGRFGGGR